jgi:hypothetical protein
VLGPHDPQHNQLLAVLAPGARERIYPQLHLSKMPLGKVLHEPAISCTTVISRSTASLYGSAPTELHRKRSFSRPAGS